MKILAICLLRAGDFLMQGEALHARYLETGDEIHVLANRSIASLRPLFPFISKWHFFHRDGVQAAIKEQRIPLVFAANHIEDLRVALAGEEYDLVINLSQNRFSARWIELINPKQFLGLGSVNGRFLVGPHDPWGQLWNDGLRRNQVHFLDIFRGLCGVVDAPKQAFTVVPSQRSDYFCVQMLTSDPKKNWGLQRWVSLIEELIVSLQINAVVLVAPGEAELIRNSIDFSLRSNMQLRIVDWLGAKELLQKATFLVTGDTSIKHLATQVGCQVIELSLGSSNYLETGAYQQDAIIIDSKTTCHPCPHVKNCEQPSYYCHESISVSAVKQIIENRYLGKAVSLEALTRVNVFQVDFQEVAFWKVKPLAIRKQKVAIGPQGKEKLNDRQHSSTAPKCSSQDAGESV